MNESDTKRLDTIKQVMQLVHNNMTKEEFTQNFKIVIELIKTFKNVTDEKIKGFEDKISRMLDAQNSSSRENLSSIRKEVISSSESLLSTKLSKFEKTFNDKINEVKTSVEEISFDSIENKIDSNVGYLNDQILKLGQQTPGLIKNEINPIVESIDLLQKQLQELKTKSLSRTGWGAHPLVIESAGTIISKNTRIINFSTNLTATNSNGIITVTGNAGGGSGSTTAVETPSGTINGSNLTFTVLYVPLWIVLNGVSYFVNNGYTISGGTITLDSSITPATGSVLRSINNGVAVTSSTNYLTDSSNVVLTDSLNNPLTVN